MVLYRRQSGALMIEVLVTIVIIVIGLMGLYEMQARLQKSEVESYQRTQALMLLNDMSSRLSSNRAYAEDYDTGTTPLGVGATCATLTSSSSRVDRDKSEWCSLLQGAAEIKGTSNKVGAMIGARGCITALPPNYLITVVWQGMDPISKPPGTLLTCGENLYDFPTGSDCADSDNLDKCRRYVSTLVRIADLNP